jgi:hypothetical protein
LCHMFRGEIVSAIGWMEDSKAFNQSWALTSGQSSFNTRHKARVLGIAETVNHSAEHHAGRGISDCPTRAPEARQWASDLINKRLLTLSLNAG